MKFETCMSTRSPKVPNRKPGEACTEYHLHKSQLSLDEKKNLFDYSEHRLKLYISTVTDEQQKISLQEIFSSYKKGLVAIAWREGKPVWLKITKETEQLNLSNK